MAYAARLKLFMRYDEVGAGCLGDPPPLSDKLVDLKGFYDSEKISLLAYGHTLCRWSCLVSKFDGVLFF